MINDTGIVPLQKNGVLVYLGDREFFQKKLGGGLLVPDETIDRAISHCVEGIVIAKGSKAFDEFEVNPQIGDKVTFNGHFGGIFSRKKEPTERMPKNLAYYRLIEDKYFDGFCTKSDEISSFF